MLKNHWNNVHQFLVLIALILVIIYLIQFVHLNCIKYSLVRVVGWVIFFFGGWYQNWGKIKGVSTTWGVVWNISSVPKVPAWGTADLHTVTRICLKECPIQISAPMSLGSIHISVSDSLNELLVNSNKTLCFFSLVCQNIKKMVLWCLPYELPNVFLNDYNICIMINGCAWIEKIIL